MPRREPPTRTADEQFRGLCRVLVTIALNYLEAHPELRAQYAAQKAERERKESA